MPSKRCRGARGAKCVLPRVIVETVNEDDNDNDVGFTSDEEPSWDPGEEPEEMEPIEPNVCSIRMIPGIVYKIPATNPLEYLDGLSFEMPARTKLPVFQPWELIGWSFLLENEDSTVLHHKVIKELHNRNGKGMEQVRFLLASQTNNEIEEIITYAELSDLVKQQCDAKLNPDEETFYAFDNVIGHQGPLKLHAKDYKGWSWNVSIK